jgi:hypothetical protein
VPRQLLAIVALPDYPETLIPPFLGDAAVHVVRRKIDSLSLNPASSHTMRIRGIISAVIATCVCLCVAGRASAAYTITNIADDSGTFFDFNNPSINADGHVAFRADLDAANVAGIFRSDSGSITTIADNTGPFQAFQFQTPGIDADGNVAFTALRRGEAGGGNGIFIGDGGGTTIFALTPTMAQPQPGDFAGFQSTVMNSEGTPAFVAAFVGGPTEGIRGGVFVGPNRVADDRGPFLSFADSLGRGLDLNNHNVVVFKAELDDNHSGIFVHAAGGIGTVADTMDPPFTGFTFSVPSINDSGEIVFWAEGPPFVSAIYRVPVDQGPQVFVDGSGPYSSFSVSPSINNSGEIVFAAQLDGAALGNGIFTGPDAVGDKVIQIGDPLFGSTFGSGSISNASLNDAGQIAFRYELANGRRGIALATPIPEPTSPDYNGNGVVDAADYVLWRKTPAAFGGDPAGYNLWRTNFGSTAGSGSADQPAGGAPSPSLAAVPEPASILMLLAVSLAALYLRRPAVGPV